jgi:hypothetical protein
MSLTVAAGMNKTWSRVIWIPLATTRHKVPIPIAWMEDPPTPFTVTAWGNGAKAEEIPLSVTDMNRGTTVQEERDNRRVDDGASTLVGGLIGEPSKID